MNIYICNAPIRFPRSEYGGLIVVMAPNKRRLGKIPEDVSWETYYCSEG